ncbi:MAG: hypothetical protein JSR17_04955 [Proteobacteria bacterium]|nr:hypothetical protein [Pseudomonadota bacterium]
MKLVSKILLAGSIVLLSACSTSPKTQVVQMGDNSLSEQQILNELARLDKTEKEINSKKGVTGTNVASFLLWWPGLAYTYYDASEAQKLIEQRRSHLTALYNQKHALNQNQKPKAKG